MRYKDIEVLNGKKVKKEKTSKIDVEKDINLAKKKAIESKKGIQEIDKDSEIEEVIEKEEKQEKVKKNKQNNKKNKNQKNDNKKGFSFKWINILIISILTGYSFYQGYKVYTSKLLPQKYMNIFFGILGLLLLNLIILIFTKKRKHIFRSILISFVSIVISVGIFVGGKYFNDINSFFHRNLGAPKVVKEEYYAITGKDSVHGDMSSVKEVVALSTDNNIDRLQDKFTASIKYEDSNDKLMSLPLVKKDNVIIAHQSIYELYLQNQANYKEKTKIIGTFELVQENVEKITKKDASKLTQKPFIVYISGIDTRTGKMPAKSLSDVNMLMAINPITHRILLVHVPRDYYVKVRGTRGLKDKLTHAGSIGGVKTSMETLEDLFGEIPIDHYIRVNFESVVRLVDAIGGIDIESELDHTFICNANKACDIRPGKNHLNGQCALAFSRERYAYLEGDRHRGQNQQQVITKIIGKMTSSKALIKNFNKILESLDGTFETNLTNIDISALLSMQLEDMSKWSISSISLSGSSKITRTYSMPSMDLYVMVPNYSQVEEAETEIKKLLKERKVEEKTEEDTTKTKKEDE